MSHYVQVDELVREIRTKRPTEMTISSVGTTADARLIHTALEQSSLRVLLFPDGTEAGTAGSPLGAWDSAELSAVYLRAWEWNWEEGPGAPNAQRQLDLVLVNQESDEIIQECFTLYATDYGLTTISRTIEALEYAETGYEGHHQEHLDPVEVEHIEDFLSIFRACLGVAEWPENG